MCGVGDILQMGYFICSIHIYDLLCYPWSIDLVRSTYFLMWQTTKASIKENLLQITASHVTSKFPSHWHTDTVEYLLSCFKQKCKIKMPLTKSLPVQAMARISFLSKQYHFKCHVQNYIHTSCDAFPNYILTQE